MLVFLHQNTIYCTKSGGLEVRRGPGAPGARASGRVWVKRCPGVFKEVSGRFYLRFRGNVYVSVACFFLKCCQRICPHALFDWPTFWQILTYSATQLGVYQFTTRRNHCFVVMLSVIVLIYFTFYRGKPFPMFCR